MLVSVIKWRGGIVTVVIVIWNAFCMHVCDGFEQGDVTGVSQKE